MPKLTVEPIKNWHDRRAACKVVSSKDHPAEHIEDWSRALAQLEFRIDDDGRIVIGVVPDAIGVRVHVRTPGGDLAQLVVGG